MSGTSVVPEAVATTEVAGRTIALHFGDPEREYRALRTGAIVVDRSYRARWAFHGAKAAETLTGLVTNDVDALTPGHGQYAAALTPKGKIIADLRIFARGDELLVDAPARAAEGWSAMVRKFVNPRVTKYAERSESTSDIGIFGVHAGRLLAEAFALDLEALATLGPYGHVTIHTDAGEAMLARVPDLAMEGYDLFASTAAAPVLWQRLVASGAMPAGMEAWEIARIEAGRPEWGVDIDDTTIPQEANFDELHAISYTKGCYTGQETVARVHFRGHVNRHLRGLRAAGRDGDRIPAGAGLVIGDEKAVGDVRSTALSPRLGPVALAMVRREVAPESSLRAVWDGGEMRVSVIALPFPL
jgi:tRNA-modifying protein YgfZ